jgi:hypothetical protein
MGKDAEGDRLDDEAEAAEDDREEKGSQQGTNDDNRASDGDPTAVHDDAGGRS